MLSDDIRGLIVQARRNIRDPAFLAHIFDRLDTAAAELETMEESAIIDIPAPPDNVVPFARRRDLRDA